MIVSAIVAAARGGVIGRDNDIPWYLPADLKYFKKTTLNHHIIMGRKCFESIGRALPKRTNIILTRNPFFTASNVIIARSLEEALTVAQDNGEEEVFIIGGGQIYEQSRSYWDRVYFTQVDLEVEGDILFTPLDSQEWNMISNDSHQPDEKNEFPYHFQVWERISKEG
ncbi:MAG: dihydrofolate reductase [Bacteroidota bacterium]